MTQTRGARAMAMAVGPARGSPDAAADVLRCFATRARSPPHYDLLITADNFARLSRSRGIQYVHFPADLQPEPARMNADRRRCTSRSAIGCWARRGPTQPRNITLANSRWTAAGLERLGEVSKPIVLYPPVLDPGEGLPWSERDDTFLCIGRFHGSKRIELAMAIVGRARARARCRDARLIVVGSAVDREYTTRIHAARGQPRRMD